MHSRRTDLGRIALVVLVAAGCGGGPQGPPDRPPTPVGFATPVVRQIIEWDRYTGRLAAIEGVDVRARVSGYLRSLHFDEGELVEKNAVLAVIDQRPFRAALASAEAQLTQARAALGQANAALVEAEAAKKKTDITYNVAKREYDRAVEQLRDDVITRSVFDVKEGAMQEAEAQQAADVGGIESAKATIASAEAAISTACAAVRTARLDLDYTVVRAPISGRIGARQVTVGNLVGGGTGDTNVLANIVSLDPIHCYFDANERALLKYSRLALEGKRESSRKVKTPVRMQLVDENGYPHEGHMDFVDNRVNPNTATMRGRAIFPNPEDLLTPGMFAEVRLPGSGSYKAVLVPDAAVQADQSERFLFVVDDDDKIVRMPVVLGPLSHGLRVIREQVSGEKLTGEERIVVSGFQGIAEGTKVAPKKEAIELRDGEGLPDEYVPVPEDKWLSTPPDAVPDAVLSEREPTVDADGKDVVPDDCEVDPDAAAVDEATNGPAGNPDAPGEGGGR